VGEVDEDLAHALVEHDGVRVLEELANDLPLFVGIYTEVLSNLRLVMVERMAKPEEVREKESALSFGDEDLAHALVEHDGVRVLEELADDLPLFVLDDEERDLHRGVVQPAVGHGRADGQARRGA
jgi:hypothetical protein